MKINSKDFDGASYAAIYLDFSTQCQDLAPGVSNLLRLNGNKCQITWLMD